MIAITRKLAQQLQTVFRRAMNIPPRAPDAPLTFQTGPEGLAVRSQTQDTAVEYRVPGPLDNEEIVAPFELLNDCKGTKQDEVKLETTGGGEVIAAWKNGIPRVTQYDPSAHVSSSGFPAVPEQMTEQPEGLLTALHDAMGTADAEAVRYCLNHIQLDGKQGRIVGTDSRQVYAQDGFEFPWDDRVLIPQRRVFGLKDLAGQEPVSIGKTEDWVTIRVGPWTFHLLIEKEGRFPQVDDLIQRPDDAAATLQVGEADAQFLLNALKRLPSNDEYNLPITVELNGAAMLRARPDSEQAPTEVTLSASTVSGEPISISTNRQYLARAMKLGFREVSLFGPEVPAVCHDGTRNYLWALLGKDGIIKPSKDATRIASQEEGTREPEKTTKPRKTRKRRPMAQSNSQNGNGKTSGSKAEETVGVDTLIESAEALKASLRESVTKTNDLISMLYVYQDAWRSREGENISFNKTDDVNTLGRLAEKMLVAFSESEFAVPAGHVIGIEEELRGDVLPDCPELLARLDLITETDGDVIVTDLKTARTRWSQQQAEDAADQLLLYSELARDLVPGKPLKLQFIVLTKTEQPVVDRHVVPVDPRGIARVKNTARRVWQAVQGGHFYPAPSAMNCPQCGFRKACRAWAG